jgi:hypothetical protein
MTIFMHFWNFFLSLLGPRRNLPQGFFERGRLGFGFGFCAGVGFGFGFCGVVGFGSGLDFSFF